MRVLILNFRSLNYWRWLLAHFLSAVGVIAIFMEIMNLAFGKLPASGWLLASVVFLSALIYGIAKTWPRAIHEKYTISNTSISIMVGDLFTQDCSIVVGTCDTFDTATPKIVAKNSVQGQAQERLWNGDTTQLDREIDEALVGINPVGTIRKDGKKDKYQVGAVAKLKIPPNNIYFLAYCKMDEKNQTHSTPDWIWESLSSLWGEIRQYENGAPVAMPVFGGKFARVSNQITTPDMIRLIVMSFIFASRGERICDELRIVVQKSEFSNLDRAELHSILHSLKAK